MKNRILACINVVLLAVLASLLMPPAATASPDDEKTTEDVIYMLDGRELHGNILEETNDEVIFQFIDRNINISTKLTLLKHEIAKIERDVAIEGAAAPVKERKRIQKKDDDDEDKPEQTYGTRRVESGGDDAPSLYILPMTGQMGTDINTDIYKKIKDDIREADPDILVIKMECRDNEDSLYSMIGPEEQGLFTIDDFRDLVNLFHDDLADVRQVLWIHDSVGTSSVIALAWSEVYMTPDARFGGLTHLSRNETNWSDADVAGKMIAAFMGMIKGFLEYGDQSLDLAEAMVRPQFVLSGTWKGREVEWQLDTDGEFIVDDSDKRTVSFRSKVAEDLCISDGTAETVDDLALLMGIREYRLSEGRGEEIFEGYTEDWRRKLEQCRELVRDYMEYADAGDLAGLGKAKTALEKILAAMERYQAVEMRLGMEYGLRKFDITTWIEILKERILALRRAGRGGGGGGGRRPPGSGGFGSG